MIRSVMAMLMMLLPVTCICIYPFAGKVSAYEHAYHAFVSDGSDLASEETVSSEKSVLQTIADIFKKLIVKMIDLYLDYVIRIASYGRLEEEHALYNAEMDVRGEFVLKLEGLKEKYARHETIRAFLEFLIDRYHPRSSYRSRWREGQT